MDSIETSRTKSLYHEFAFLETFQIFWKVALFTRPCFSKKKREGFRARVHPHNTTSGVKPMLCLIFFYRVIIVHGYS